MNDVFAQLLHYIFSNWASISITLFISLLSLYGSHRLLSRYQISEYEKRLNRAKRSVLDILENYIINDERITPQKIDTLIAAVDRRSSIEFSDEVSNVSILQDLGLRIEESRHLDINQKHQYSEKIERTIEEIRKEEQADGVSKGKDRIIEDLSNNIKNGGREEALEDVERLKVAIGREEDEKEVEKVDTTEIKLVQATMALIMSTMLIGGLSLIEFSSLGLLGITFMNLGDMLKIAVSMVVFLSILNIFIEEL